MSYMSLSPYTGKDNVTRKHGGEHKADVAAIDGEDASSKRRRKGRKGKSGDGSGGGGLQVKDYQDKLSQSGGRGEKRGVDLC